MRPGTGVAFNRWFGRGWLGLGYLFLYVPIVALVIYSFNDSPIPNVWRGFTLKWYAALAQDSEMLAGLWLSMKIAFLTACRSSGTTATPETALPRSTHGRSAAIPAVPTAC